MGIYFDLHLSSERKKRQRKREKGKNFPIGSLSEEKIRLLKNVGNIINNAAGIAGATYYVTVDPSKASGRYYLAGNATGINSLTITGTSTILKVGGGGATLDGNTYFALDRDIYNNLYLDIAKISGIAASCGDLESVDLGTWDAVETGCDASLVTSDERKDTGLLAIA